MAGEALGEAFRGALVSTEQGTKTKMELASLFGTWGDRALNPFGAYREMLVSPQVGTVSMAEACWATGAE